MDETFNVEAELKEVQELRAMQRRRKYRRSKLERYRAELVALKQAGASSQDLATWLRMKHRLKIHRSSVDRYLSQLPELAKASAPVQAPPQPAAAPTPPPEPQRVPLSPFDSRG
jgi:hypothetical protein